MHHLFHRLFLSLTRLRIASERGFAGTSFAMLSMAGGTVLVGSIALDGGSSALGDLDQVLRASISRVSSQVEVRGAVVVEASGAPVRADTVKLTLGSFGSGTGVLLSNDTTQAERLVIAYQDGAGYAPNVPYSVATITGDEDGLLEPGEQVLLTIRRTDIEAATGKTALAPNGRWTMELNSAVGGSVEVSRTMPSVLQGVMRLP